jgi:hypothetical protein
MAKMEKAGYTDMLPLVSRYLRHLNKVVQDAILALDTMLVRLTATISAALNCEAHLIRKAGLVPVMRSFQGSFTSQRPSPPSFTNVTSPTPTTSSSPSYFTSHAPPRIPKDLTDSDLIAAMTKLFTSTKSNDALHFKIMANKICLICRWQKSHATGCPQARNMHMQLTQFH